MHGSGLVSDRFWLPLFTAFVIWARFASGQVWGVGTFGGLIIIGIAAENLLNTFWKDKALVGKDRWRVRFWQPPKPPASLSKRALSSSQPAKAVGVLPALEASLREPAVAYLPKSYGPKTRES